MKGLEKKPEIIVFAGPNGSGKSTITELLKPPIVYINADEIKRIIRCSDLDAAKLAEYATIPSREGLLTMLAGGMIGIARDLSICLDLYSQQKEEN